MSKDALGGWRAADITLDKQNKFHSSCITCRRSDVSKDGGCQNLAQLLPIWAESGQILLARLMQLFS